MNNLEISVKIFFIASEICKMIRLSLKIKISAKRKNEFLFFF